MPDKTEVRVKFFVATMKKADTAEDFVEKLTALCKEYADTNWYFTFDIN